MKWNIRLLKNIKILNSCKNNIKSFGKGNKINLNYHYIKYRLGQNDNYINIK